MTELNVEIIGTEPPCSRCLSLKKVVEAAASTLKESGIDVKISKLNILAKDATSKYGILVPPVLVIDGVVKVMGRVPSVNEIVKLFEKSTK